jgi:hypothetical protein
MRSDLGFPSEGILHNTRKDNRKFPIITTIWQCPFTDVFGAAAESFHGMWYLPRDRLNDAYDIGLLLPQCAQTCRESISAR